MSDEDIINQTDFIRYTLPCTDISINFERCSVEIMSCESPSSFYLRKLNCRDYYHSLFANMKEHYFEVDIDSGLSPTDIPLGSYWCVKIDEWAFRAKVMKINAPSSYQENFGFEMFLVDFGMTKTAEIFQIQCLDDLFVLDPPWALHCSLAQEEENSDELDLIDAAMYDSFSDEDSNSSEGSSGCSSSSSSSDEEGDETGKILDILIPPVEWRDVEGIKNIQRVCRLPPGRSDVIQLWEHLELKLDERQARSYGICSIRRDLYQEAFDELIRQVTIDCPERGLLLARVRDEASMTIAAFQSLFKSASEFGATKAIQAESGKSELEDDLLQLEERVSSLEAEVRRLEAWRRQVGRRARERREVQMALFTEELETLQRSEQQYQILIETLLASKSTTT